MHINAKGRLICLISLIALVLSIFGAAPVMAEEDTIEIVLEDVTGSDATTLTGEAKVRVSIKGTVGDVSAAQVALSFSGDLDYKSVDFLQEVDAAAVEDPYTVNTNNKFSAGFAVSTSIAFQDVTPLYIVTFEGEPGGSVTLVADNEHSFCYAANESVYATGESSITAHAAESANEGMTATIKIKMDKVKDFIAGRESGITLEIIDEANENSIRTVLSSENRDNTTDAEFTVTNTVIKGNTYTVKLSGIGYVAYEKNGVTFDDVLTITNSDLVPGDVNKDGVVNDEDKAAYDELVAADEYNPAADFNRDGYVDEKDNMFDTSDSDNDNNDNDNDSDGSTGDNSSTGGDSSGDSSDSDSSGGGSSGGGSTGGGSAGGGGGSGGGSFGGGSFGGGSIIPVSKETFTDLGNYAWAKESIYALKNKGIINGISATEYAPANNIRRADFILILTRMLSINNSFTENFADVPADSYYYNAVGSAKAAGIAQGSGESFMPENTITRQDLITLAYRAFLTKGYISGTDDMTSLDAFADKDSISDYALAPMASMVKAGIIQGSDGRVNPLGNATRAEVAVMCARLLALIK